MNQDQVKKAFEELKKHSKQRKFDQSRFCSQPQGDKHKEGRGQCGYIRDIAQSFFKESQDMRLGGERIEGQGKNI